MSTAVGAAQHVALGGDRVVICGVLLGIQERPEDVPTGELPRAVTLVADRHLVGRVAPGTRVTVTGIYSICQVGP
jgi:MCM OB domain